MKSRLLWFALAAAAALAISPWFGAELITPSKLADPTEWDIFARFRLTRTALGFLAGASLSACGCLLQAVLRNPLADPFTLGVSSGAALGGVIAIFLGIPWVWTGSITGASIALAIIAGIGLTDRRLTSSSLILAGVSVNSVCSALIMLMQSTAGYSKSFAVTTWLIGALDAKFKVTRERIRQIEAKALRKMRHPTRIRQLQGFLETEEPA